MSEAEIEREIAEEETESAQAHGSENRVIDVSLVRTPNRRTFSQSGPALSTSSGNLALS